VNGFLGWDFDEIILFAHEAILTVRKDGLKRTPLRIVGGDQQRSSVMSAFLTFIYRAYCRARLAEMHKRAWL